jgi:hypothetical protein
MPEASRFRLRPRVRRELAGLPFGIWLAARAAFADPSAAPLDVRVAASPDAYARLESAVGDAAHPIRWSRAPQIDTGAILERPAVTDADEPARVWIDGSRSDRLRVYFVNCKTERFLVRDVPLPDGLNDVALETVAQVIESSVAALLAGAAVGMTREEMATELRPPPAPPIPALPPPPAPVDARAGRWEPSIGAFYAAQAFASEVPVEHGPGLLVHIDRAADRWIAGAWVSAQYQLPERVRSSLAGARLDTLALRGGAEVGRSLDGRWGVGARIGAGVDAVHIAPRSGSSAASATLTADRFSWTYALHLALVATVRASRHVAVSLAAVADVDVNERHYDVSIDGALTRVATPWPVRPGVLLELAWR